MTYQLDLTQKKNGTFLAEAREADSARAEQESLRANPFRDAEAFRSALKTARLATETQTSLEQAAREAEGREEVPVRRKVEGVEREQLRRIGLN